jgi:SAM-dependent MidA family methyltransferase
MTSYKPFSQPSVVAQQHSDRLLSVIQQQIKESHGKISFAKFMQLCLYYPGLGYYSAGSQKLGPLGDFTTSPEISSLFSQTLARQLQDASKQLDSFDLLEFGAGSGKMAIDILLQLEEDNALPSHYYIIEASANLQARQLERISHAIPRLKNKISWLTSFPLHFTGIILANEVCDAMPFHRLHFENGKPSECYVEEGREGIQWTQHQLLNKELSNRSDTIHQINGGNDYYAEVNLTAEAWLTSLASCMKQGALFIIDYGHCRNTYYHPQRQQGTMMCYYQHQGHENPLILPGLQDITSHIDFTALAETALAAGLNVEGFQTQADFLLAGGITELLQTNEKSENTFNDFQQKTALKRLILPSEMGENFKVLTLTKRLPELLPRLQLADRRYSL